MYWQTNDIWQGASWASVDYTGRYKMVQYFVQNAYAPVLISPDGSALHNTFSLTIINDQPFAHSHVSGEVTLTMRCVRFNPSSSSLGTGCTHDVPCACGLAVRRWDSVASSSSVKSWVVEYDAPPASATNVTSSSFQEMLRIGGCEDATECFLTVVAFNGSAATGQAISQNYLLLAPFYDIVTMRPPRLNISSVRPVTRGDVRSYENAFAVTVTAVAPAAFVWLETQYPGRWSENGFVMTEAAKEVVFYQDTSSHHHMPPDRLLHATSSSGIGRRLPVTWQPTGNVSAQDLWRDLSSCRWTNPSLPDDPPTLVLKPGQGSLFSLADTSPEYTSASSR